MDAHKRNPNMLQLYCISLAANHMAGLVSTRLGVRIILLSVLLVFGGWPLWADDARRGVFGGMNYLDCPLTGIRLVSDACTTTPAACLGKPG